MCKHDDLNCDVCGLSNNAQCEEQKFIDHLDEMDLIENEMENLNQENNDPKYEKYLG